MAQAKFPGKTITWKDKVDFQDEIKADDINQAYAEIIAIENTMSTISNSESQRIANENTRIANESNRITEFNNIKTTYDTATHENTVIELVNARHDNTTNTNYNNICERMDAYSSDLVDIAVNVKSFESAVVGGDWGLAFMAAHDSLPSTGGIITFKQDVTIKTPLVFTKKIFLIGTGYSSLNSSALRPKSSILKDGNFVGISLKVQGSVIKDVNIEGLTSNGGDGINVLASRCTLENVSSHNHGGDGIRIGGSNNENCNCWRAINVYTLGNAGHGFHIEDTLNASLPNTNAGMMLGLDTRSNTGDGLRVQNSIDNGFYSVCAQQNGGKGVRIMSNASGHQFYNPYTEANVTAEFDFEANSKQNYVFGYRTANADNFVDSGSDNFVLGRDNQTTLGNVPFLRTYLQMLKVGIRNPSISGVWTNEVDGTNRNLIFKLMSTSSTGNVVFKHNVDGTLVTTIHDKIQIGGGTIVTKHINAGMTVDILPISANSQSEVTITVSGVALGDTVIASPSGVPENGLLWNAYVSATDTIKIRFTNMTATSLAMAVRPWKVDIWKH